MSNENRPGTVPFVNEAYKHCKAIYLGDGTDSIMEESNIGRKKHQDPAILQAGSKNADEAFIIAFANHRVTLIIGSGRFPLCFYVNIYAFKILLCTLLHQTRVQLYQ